MKQTILTLIGVCAICFATNAQITYLGELNASVMGLYELREQLLTSTNVNKLFSKNRTKIEVYSTSTLALEKVINLDTTGYDATYFGQSTGRYLDFNIDVTQTVFNTDDKLEIIYSYPLASGYSRLVVMNEDGMILLDHTSTVLKKHESYYLFRTSNEFFLSLGYSESNGTPSKIYKLGGVPCSHCSSGTSGSKILTPKVNISLFPNPTSNELNIQIDGETVGMMFEIYSSTGGLVASGNIMGTNTAIDVSNFASGSYVCKLTNNGEFIFSDLFIKN